MRAHAAQRFVHAEFMEIDGVLVLVVHELVRSPYFGVRYEQTWGGGGRVWMALGSFSSFT